MIGAPAPGGAEHGAAPTEEPSGFGLGSALGKEDVGHAGAMTTGNLSVHIGSTAIAKVVA